MAKKTTIAFDIGESYIKIARVNGGNVHVREMQMPENLMSEGMVQMPHMLTDFLKQVKKECHLSGAECGLVVPDEVTVCRNVTLPAMTVRQLEGNLPFEFNDYISNDPTRYVYDYALQEMYYDEDGKPQEMLLTGAVMSKEMVRSYVEIFKNAGLKLRTLIPQEIAIANLMRAAVEAGRADADKEYCLVNLGHRATQVYIFKGAIQSVLRNIHTGNRSVDQVIAEHEAVDEFVARTYKNRNYNQVLDKEYCQEVFGKLAVEIMKVINFYRFNNRETQLEDIYFFGGGSNLPQLCESIAETNDLHMKSIFELLPEHVDREMNPNGVLALGVLMQ